MNKPKLIHALLIFLVLFCGCIDPFLRPGSRHDLYRENPASFKKQYELNLELASKADEFSKSLAYIHYMLARRYSIIYDTSDKRPTDSIKDAEAFVSKLYKMEDEIIYPARAKAIDESANDLLSLAIYMYGKGYEYNINANPEMLIDIAMAYENQDKKDIADKFIEHFIKWNDGSEHAHAKASGCIRLAKYYYQKGDLSRTISFLQDGIKLISKADHTYLKPECVCDATYLAVVTGDKELALKAFSLLFEQFRYKKHENPFIELFAKLKSKSEFDLIISASDEIEELDARYMILRAFYDNLKERTVEPNLMTYIDEITRIAKKKIVTHENAVLLLELASEYHRNGQIEKANSIVDFVFDSKKSGITVNVFYFYPIEVTKSLIESGHKEKALELIKKENEKIITTSNIHGGLAIDYLKVPSCYAIVNDDANVEKSLNDVLIYAKKASYDANNLWPGYMMIAACYSISGNKTKAEEILDKAFEMLKARNPERNDVIRISDEFSFGLKELTEFNETKEIIQYLDTKDVNYIYTAAIINLFVKENKLDEAFDMVTKIHEASMRQTVVLKLADCYLTNGDYEKVIALSEMLTESNQLDEKNQLIEKACAKASESGKFDYAYGILWHENEIVEEPQRLSSCIIGYLKYNTLPLNKMSSLQNRIYIRMRRMEYIRSLAGVKDFELAQKAESTLDGFADYIYASKDTKELSSKLHIVPRIPESELNKATKLFDEGKYDECFKRIKKANETDWSPKIFIGDPIYDIAYQSHYWFNDFPEKFASVKRFDLAIKTFRYVELAKLPDSIRKVNHLIIESSYKLTDDDWFELRSIIHEDRFFWKYPYLEVEINWNFFFP